MLVLRLSVIDFSISIFHFFFRSCFRFSDIRFQFSVSLCSSIFSFFIFMSIDKYLDHLLRLMLRWLSISLFDFPSNFQVFRGAVHLRRVSVFEFIVFSFPILEFSLSLYFDGIIYLLCIMPCHLRSSHYAIFLL